MAKFILFFPALFNFLIASAQVEKIDTDRPDQTESAAIVPKKYFQAEFGFNKENMFYRDYNIIHPTALLKYGFKKFELRLEATCLSAYEDLTPDPKWTTGFEPIEIGFKAALWEERNLLPKTSLIIHLGIPELGSKAFRPDHLAPSFRFTMQHTVNEVMGIGYNLGAEWDGVSSTPIWIYTLSPGFNFGKYWYAYIEAFGFIQNGTPFQHSIDGGIAYYINHDAKVDFSGGFGLNSSTPKNYIAVGFSFRINAGKK